MSIIKAAKYFHVLYTDSDILYTKKLCVSYSVCNMYGVFLQKVFVSFDGFEKVELRVSAICICVLQHGGV